MSNCVITNLDTVTIYADRFGDLVQKEADLDRLLGFLLDGLYADKDYSDKNNPKIYFDSDPGVPRALRLLFPEDTPPESGVTRSAWLLKASAKYVRETGKCVLADIQKKFTLGYAEAARLISALADLGVVGEPTEGGGREILPFEEVSEDD